MQTLSAFSLQTPSWWIAIGISLILHVVLIFYYQSENKNTNVFDASTELEISLNKISAPQAQALAENSPENLSENVPENIPENIQEAPHSIAASSPVSANLNQAKPKTIVQPKIVKPKLAPPMQSDQVQAVEKKISQQTNLNTIARPAATQSNNSLRHQRNMQKIKADYLAKLSMWLNQHKRYPAVARRRGQEGEITVRFSINAEGKLLSHEIVSPARHASLNAAVVKMLNTASPMPAIPAELRNGKTKFEYTIPVLFKLTDKS